MSYITVEVSLAGDVIKDVPAATFLRWKTNETLWGWADSPPRSATPICHSQRLVLSRSAFLHDLHPSVQDERGGSGLCPPSSLRQGGRGRPSVGNTCKLRVMRQRDAPSPVLPALINPARHQGTRGDLQLGTYVVVSSSCEVDIGAMMWHTSTWTRM